MPTPNTASPDQAKAEREWWASLTPEQGHMARDEEAVREMASKITINLPKPQAPPTPERIEEARQFVNERVSWQLLCSSHAEARTQP